jgi:hypothetical protein
MQRLVFASAALAVAHASVVITRYTDSLCSTVYATAPPNNAQRLYAGACTTFLNYGAGMSAGTVYLFVGDGSGVPKCSGQIYASGPASTSCTQPVDNTGAPIPGLFWKTSAPTASDPPLSAIFLAQQYSACSPLSAPGFAFGIDTGSCFRSTFSGGTYAKVSASGTLTFFGADSSCGSANLVATYPSAGSCTGASPASTLSPYSMNNVIVTPANNFNAPGSGAASAAASAAAALAVASAAVAAAMRA